MLCVPALSRRNLSVRAKGAAPPRSLKTDRWRLRLADFRFSLTILGRTAISFVEIVNVVSILKSFALATHE